MQRRSLLKLAAGAAAGGALTRVVPVEATPAEPYMVGTGCIKCRPDLYPMGIGKDMLPSGPNHHRVDWVDWKRTLVSPTIKLGGVPIRGVAELMTGPDGWLRRNHELSTLNTSNRAHLCECGSGELQVELWRGNVTQEGIVQATPAELTAAAEACALRLSRFDYIEQFVSYSPEYADQVYAEQRDHPGQVPMLFRTRLEDEPDWKNMTKRYLPGPVYLGWIDYNRQPAPTEREVWD